MTARLDVLYLRSCAVSPPCVNIWSFAIEDCGKKACPLWSALSGCCDLLAWCIMVRRSPLRFLFCRLPALLLSLPCPFLKGHRWYAHAVGVSYCWPILFRWFVILVVLLFLAVCLFYLSFASSLNGGDRGAEKCYPFHVLIFPSRSSRFSGIWLATDRHKTFLHVCSAINLFF